jgi:hypothetical protein
MFSVFYLFFNISFSVISNWNKGGSARIKLLNEVHQQGMKWPMKCISKE